MNRREYLALGGIAVSGALAGCSETSTDDSDGGNGDEGDSDEAAAAASFTDVTISAPNAVTVDGEFSVTVSATNEGDAAGDYEDELVATEGPIDLEESIAFTGVEAGETATTEFGPFAVDHVAECAFELTDAGVSHDLSVEPLTAAVDETLSLGDGLEATLREVRYQSSLFYTESVSAGLSSQSAGRVFTTPDGVSLVVFELEFENVGTSDATVASDAFAFSESDFYTSLSGGQPLESATLESEPFAARELMLSPSETAEGWLLAQIEADASGTPTLGYHRSGTSSTDLRWELPLEGDEPATPTFELVAVDAPDAASQSYEITATVRNTSNVDGTFRGVLQYENGGDWFELTTATQSRFEAEVPAGETREISAINEPSASGEYTYRLAPFDEEEWTTDLS